MTVAQALPEPLVPAEVDLQDYPYTPVIRTLLFGSAFHAKASDAEWRAGVTLWLKSWEQVPAGTLPDDEVELCRLAELGRDLKTWRKVRDRALHKWVKCGDNRLHHPIMAQVVLEAWGKRSKNSKKGKAGAAKRWGTGNAAATKSDSRTKSTSNGTATASANGPAIAQPIPGDSKVREDKRREEPPVVPLAVGGGPAIVAAPPADPILVQAREILGAYTRAICEVWELPANGGPIPRHGPKGDFETAKAWAKDGITVELCLDVFGPTLKAKRSRDGEMPGGLVYLDNAVRRAHAAKGAPTVAEQAPPDANREARARRYLDAMERYKRDSAHGDPGYPMPDRERYMRGDHDNDDWPEMPAFLKRVPA